MVNLKLKGVIVNYVITPFLNNGLIQVSQWNSLFLMQGGGKL